MGSCRLHFSQEQTMITLIILCLGVGTLATNGRGSLESRNFPSNYPNNLDTEEDISVAAGERIKLQFIDFKIEDHSSCAYDYLMVEDADGTVLLDKTCGTTLPKDVTSRTNTVIVIFHSDGSVSDSGWRIDWQKLTNSDSCTPEPDSWNGGDCSQHVWACTSSQYPWYKEYCSTTCNYCEPVIITPPSSCNCSIAQRATRIVNGVETEVNEYPWQVGLTYRGLQGWFRPRCGGSLINDRYVLTAAHCTAGQSTTSMEVWLGDHDLRTDSETTTVQMYISAIIDHPGYDDGVPMAYDISLLKLSTAVDFARHPHIRPVCLPASGTTYSVGDPLVVTGWGNTNHGGSNSPVLQEVTVNYVSNAECRANYSSIGRAITDDMLCASAPSKDSCQNDSGGPLVQAMTDDNNYTQAGVVSWGEGCALPGYPGVYARVTSVLDQHQHCRCPVLSCNIEEFLEKNLYWLKWIVDDPTGEFDTRNMFLTYLHIGLLYIFSIT